MNRRTILVFLIIAAMGLAVANGACAAELTDATGQWKYVLENGGAVISGYVEEPDGDLIIPGELDGHTVTSIGAEAFMRCLELTDVTIPDGVTHIGDYMRSSSVKVLST